MESVSGFLCGAVSVQSTSQSGRLLMATAKHAVKFSIVECRSRTGICCYIVHVFTS